MLIAAAGLRILSSESIGSEWKEFSKEREGLSSRQLLRAARMIRLSASASRPSSAARPCWIEEVRYWPLSKGLRKAAEISPLWGQGRL